MPRVRQLRLEIPDRWPSWAIGIAMAVIALAALVAGSSYGDIHSSNLDPRLIGWISAGVLLVAGVAATTRLSLTLGRLAARRSMAPAGGGVRIVSATVGYIFVLFSVLAVLQVSIGRLLVGAGLVGIVLGIAAQQSLGNVFAGFVLIATRPFDIGDRIRIRSGAMGGIFEALVLDMGLTYVSLRADDGDLKVPNSAMLAAGVYRLPPADQPG